MTSEFCVITASGLPVFGPDTKAACREYLAQAIKKGSAPGFLQIIPQEDVE